MIHQCVMSADGSYEVSTNVLKSTDAGGWRYYLAYACVYVVWGSTFLAIRIAVDTIPPFLMAGSRFVLAGVLLYAVLRLRGAPAPTWRQWRSAAVVGLLLIAFGNGAVAWAEQFIVSSLAALLVALEPVWIALMEGARSKAWPRPRTWAGIALGIVGVGMLMWSPGEAPTGTAAYLPMLVVVISGWAWAAGSIYSRYAPRPKSSLVSASMHMMTGGAAMLALSLATEGGVAWSSISTASFVAWLYLIVFGSWVAFTAYVWLLQVDSPTRVSTHAYVNPIIAVLLGWAIASEPLTMPMLAAAGAIVLAVITILHRPRRPAPPRHVMKPPQTRTYRLRSSWRNHADVPVHAGGSLAGKESRLASPTTSPVD